MGHIWTDSEWHNVAALRRKQQARAIELREARQRQAKAKALGCDGDKVRAAMAALYESAVGAETEVAK